MAAILFKGRWDVEMYVLKCTKVFISSFHIDGFVQERRKSIANALELRISCTKPSIWNLCL